MRSVPKKIFGLNSMHSNIQKNIDTEQNRICLIIMEEQMKPTKEQEEEHKKIKEYGLEWNRKQREKIKQGKEDWMKQRGKKK